MLPDRGVKGAIRLYAVIVRPLLATRLLLGRCERRYAFPVLRILHHEPFRGLRERDDVVALSEKMHPFAVEDLQHLVIGRHVVGFQEGLARDRRQLPIEDSLSDAIGAPVPFVPVVRPQHSFENRLELSLGVFGFDMFVSILGHVAIPCCEEARDDLRPDSAERERLAHQQNIISSAPLFRNANQMPRVHSRERGRVSSPSPLDSHDPEYVLVRSEHTQ